MNWREALRAVARNLRTRTSNVHEITSDPLEKAENDGKRFAWNVIANDLEYFASCKPYEGLQKLREFGGVKAAPPKPPRACSEGGTCVYTPDISSIPVGESVARGCGEDAIRVVALYERSTADIARIEKIKAHQNIYPTVGVYKGKRIHRTGSVEKVLERVHERAREAYATINEKLGVGTRRSA